MKEKILLTQEIFLPKLAKNKNTDLFYIFVLYIIKESENNYEMPLDFIKNESCNDYEKFEDILNILILNFPELYGCQVSCDTTEHDNYYDGELHISWQDKEFSISMIDDRKNIEFCINIFDDDLFGNGHNVTFKEFFSELIPFLKENYDLELEFRDISCDY